jgi:sugar lactone lactonase YvrE
VTALEDVQVEVAADVRCDLGEGPVWDAELGRLLFVDIFRERVHLLDPATGSFDTYEVGQAVGALAPRRAGGLVLAVRAGFATLDLASGEVRTVATISAPPTTRMNDGECDPQGRFWAGTLRDDGTHGTSTLYRLDPGGEVTSMLEGVSVSNGLAWSADGATVYYVDSPTQRIDAFAFDGATGTLAERRSVAEIPAEIGMPDGMTIDADGDLWVAVWGGSQVRRYRPDGRLEGIIAVPASQVTSCAFGGPELADLYITTASRGLERPEPLAGALFRCRAGAHGVPVSRFAG